MNGSRLTTLNFTRCRWIGWPSTVQFHSSQVSVASSAGLVCDRIRPQGHCAPGYSPGLRGRSPSAAVDSEHRRLGCERHAARGDSIAFSTDPAGSNRDWHVGILIMIVPSGSDGDADQSSTPPRSGRDHARDGGRGLRDRCRRSPPGSAPDSSGSVAGVAPVGSVSPWPSSALLTTNCITWPVVPGSAGHVREAAEGRVGRGVDHAHDGAVVQAAEVDDHVGPLGQSHQQAPGRWKPAAFGRWSRHRDAWHQRSGLAGRRSRRPAAAGSARRRSGRRGSPCWACRFLFRPGHRPGSGSASCSR